MNTVWYLKICGVELLLDYLDVVFRSDCYRVAWICIEFTRICCCTMLMMLCQAVNVCIKRNDLFNLPSAAYIFMGKLKPFINVREGPSTRSLHHYSP